MNHRFHKLMQLRREVGVALNRPSCRTRTDLKHSVPAPARTGFRIWSAAIIVVEVGSTHELFIRGQGGSLSWHRGQRLTHAESGLWVWSTDADAPEFEFQVLLDDEICERAQSHRLKAGATIHVTPDFEWPEIPKTAPRESLQPAFS